MKKSEICKRLDAIERHIGLSSEPAKAIPLEIGRWYRSLENGDLIFNLGDGAGYGFHNTFWTKQNEGFFNFDQLPDSWEKADIELVRDMLLSEEKRRGYIEGSEVICLTNGANYIIGSREHWSEFDGQLWRVSVDNVGIAIFQDGKWAEIVRKGPKWNEPQLGNVCKFWDDDPSDFIIGELSTIDKKSAYPYESNIGTYRHATPVSKSEVIELLFGKEK